jgi:hypothetical protein
MGGLGPFTDILTQVKTEDYRGFKFKGLALSGKYAQKALH